MKFTKLDLTTKLEAIATKQRSVFDAANDKPKIKQQTLKLLEAEISRQIGIYLKEEKAYCARINEIRELGEGVTGDAVDWLKDLQKLKDKPKNAQEIKKTIDRINSNARIVVSGKKEMVDLGNGLLNHMDFRNNKKLAGYKDAEAVIGAAACKALDGYFTKLRTPAVQWIGLVKAERMKIREHVKRMQMAVNIAKAAKGQAATALTAMNACNRQLDQLDQNAGDLSVFFDGPMCNLAPHMESFQNNIMRVVNGKDKKTGKALADYIKIQQNTLSTLKTQMKSAQAIAKTASLRYTNLQKLGKKISLPAASKTRLSAAKTRIKDMDKLNKKAATNFDKCTKSFTKLEKMPAK